MIRVVLDTNVFVSAVIKSEGNASKIIKEWKNNSLDIFTSSELLEEVRKVLHYPKIMKITRWDEIKIDEYIERLYFFTNVVDISEIDYFFEKDPNDNHIVATYLASKSDYLITGDKALLSLEDIKVVSLDQFVQEHCF